MYESKRLLLYTEDRERLVKFINGIRCRECSHYVGMDLHESDGFIYCEDCATAFNDQEEKARLQEISNLEKRLEELKKRG